jgi:photosystem II stability/assembly factor-like uncharacterized protein
VTDSPTLLVQSGGSVARLERGPDAAWAVESTLVAQDVRCLAAAPSGGGLAYAGTQGNGVFRSSDGGRSWSQAGMSGAVVKSIAVSPHDPRVVYAGTRPALVFRSADGGKTWDELTGFRRIRNRWLWWSPAESPWKAYVNAITVSPAEPDRILAGIEFGAVVLSEDGGRTWSPHRRGALRDCHAMKFHARDGNWVYEAGGTGGGASVSHDGGVTWRKVQEGLAVNYGVACAADPERPEIWYLSVAPGPGKAYANPAKAYLYRASGGAAWQPIGWEPHPMSQMPLVLLTVSGAPGHLYAGTTAGAIWHSSDHGDTWSRLPVRLEGSVHSLVIL